jgi:hypothetical protein
MPQSTGDRTYLDFNCRGAKVEFTWLKEDMDKAMQAVFHMLPELERVATWKG